MFGQVKAMNVLFHQSADVYCPQEVLHLIHNAGGGISAQVRLHMTDNPLFLSHSLVLSLSGTLTRSLWTVLVAFICSSKQSV